MQPSIFLCAATAVLVLFAGCLGEGESVELSSTNVPSGTTGATDGPGGSTPPDDSGAGGQDPGSSPDEDDEVPPAPPKKPVVNFTVDQPNGSIPYEPTFTITDAADGGGPYNWTVDFGDGNETNGTDLPAAVSHTYEEVGDYTVNVTLENPAGSSKASINVTANDFATQRYVGEWETGLLACTASTQAEWAFSDLNETTHVEFEVLNTTWDMPFSVIFDAEGATEWKVDFYDEDHVFVDTFADAENSTINGTVPEDAALVVLWACNPAGGGSAEYLAAPEEEWERQEARGDEQ